ncbi:hypothetical protein [Beijerinckia sp. L45]|uniref:hypothetical protein n=1 Tax=Beijerinckia sp. L45 TaxID=1641855 RepID=UPI00131B9B74|nr:hypothetical protein [Beijerinckia sp. L45]
MNLPDKTGMIGLPRGISQEASFAAFWARKAEDAKISEQVLKRLDAERGRDRHLQLATTIKD